MARIIVTDQFDADIKVMKARDAWDADLVVCVVDQFDEQGKDELWHYVESERDATCKIFWVDNAWDADLKVLFTNNQWEAGWKKSSSLQGRL